MTSPEQASSDIRERFYRSVAETLALLHATSVADRQSALQRVADILASTMELPLVWIGRRHAAQADVVILAAAGSAAAYASTLQLSTDETRPGGHGPVAVALRQQHAHGTLIDAPEFQPWQEAARQHGFGSCIVAVSGTRDGGHLVLTAYSRDGEFSLNEEFLDWEQRLADELSWFWDHQALLERSNRMRRYRDAQRAIQRALLDQPDPEAVYQALARALVDTAGAAYVEVFVADESNGMLHRAALAGPITDFVLSLPLPPQYDEGPSVLAPTLVFMRGMPMIHRRPPVMLESM